MNRDRKPEELKAPPEEKRLILETVACVAELAGKTVEQVFSEQWQYRWDLHEMSKLDQTQVTTWLALEHIIAQQTDVPRLTLYEAALLREYDNALMELGGDTVKRLSRQISVTEVLKVTVREARERVGTERFMNGLREALSSYGSDLTQVEPLLADAETMVLLRLSAIHNMKKLREFQFTTGTRLTGRPIYYKHVFLFWNINSFIELMMKMEDGVMLALINTSNQVHSYFAFGIKNGGNIYVVTDKQKEPHPEFRNRTRRPDRDLQRRVEEGYFPYELLNLVESSDGHGLFVDPGTALVPHQGQLFRLGDLSTFDPYTQVWLTMMLELLVFKYFENEVTLPLSFTGEMVKLPRRLIEKIEEEQLPAVKDDSATLQTKSLTVADVSLAAVQNEEVKTFRQEPIGHNEWMVERYGQDVTEDVLNVLATERSSDMRLLLKDDGTHEVGPDTRTDTEKFFERTRSVQTSLYMSSLQPDTFGTKQELESDRRWIARHNLAAIVRHRAEEEFKRTVDDVKQWYFDAVLKNKERILRAIASGSWIEPGAKQERHYPDSFVRGWATEDHEMLTVRHDHEECMHYDPSQVNLVRGYRYAMNRTAYLAGVRPVPGHRNKGFYFTDVLTGTAPVTTRVTVSPSSSVGLSLLTGYPIGQLPDVLQHFYTGRPYTGNSILDRLDPVDDLRNPWAEMGVEVIVLFSKTGWKKLLKDYT